MYTYMSNCLWGSSQEERPLFSLPNALPLVAIGFLWWWTVFFSQWVVNLHVFQLHFVYLSLIVKDKHQYMEPNTYVWDGVGGGKGECIWKEIFSFFTYLIVWIHYLAFPFLQTLCRNYSMEKKMIHLQHLLYLHWLVLLSNNQGLDFTCLLIWGVLFEMFELRHWRCLFPIKEGHQQLCQGSVKVVESKCTCKLSCNCLVGHRETDVLAGKALEGRGSHYFVTAACFFSVGMKDGNHNLYSHLRTARG